MTSCNKYVEVSKENLPYAFILNSSPTFRGYFYEGSDTVYHYFKGKWDMEKDKYFKIPINGLSVVKRFEFNKDTKELGIDLIKEGKEKFGENKFYTLYIARNK